MSTMRYCTTQLKLAFPFLTNRECIHLFNLAKNHRHNQNKLENFALDEQDGFERNERGISIASTNLECFEWAIEKVTNGKFEIVDWIVNEEIEEIVK